MTRQFASGLWATISTAGLTAGAVAHGEWEVDSLHAWMKMGATFLLGVVGFYNMTRGVE